MVRASAAAPGFDADAADVATVAQICRRLDGLPLAIELAAARLRALSLEQIATRLDDRFRLLRAGERTLEAVVAWSYDLLTDAEREVFVRLAVFPADFSLEAAEMVVSDAVVEEGDVLDLLTRLVEKSLVTTVITDDTYRYRLLETLREYALARLDERGEVDRWNDRLLEWAMTRVEYVEASLRRPAQDAALQSVIADAVTLRAAMNWADTTEATSSPHCGSPRRYRSASSASDDRSSLTCSSASVVPPMDWVAGVAYSALGKLAFDQGDWLAASEAATIAREHFVAAGSDRDAGWADAERCVRRMGHGRPSGGRSAELQGHRRCSETGLTRWASATRCGSRRSGHLTSTRPSDWPQKPTSSCERPARRWGSPTTSKDAGSSPTTGMSSLTRPRSSPKPSSCSPASAISGAALTPSSRPRSSSVEAGQPEMATELLGAADELRRSSGANHKPWEIRARHGDIEDRIAPLSPAAREAALTAGRQHTLESAARAALDALSTAARE